MRRGNIVEKAGDGRSVDRRLENEKGVENQKIKTGLCGFYRGVITVFGLSILLFLTSVNAVNTCYLAADEVETTFFVKDSAAGNVAVCMILAAILFLCQRSVRLQRWVRRLDAEARYYRLIRNLILGVILILGFLWVWKVRLGSGADQELILQAVKEFRNGDYSTFAGDGYLARCRHQLGLTLVMLILSYPFGDQLEFGYQILNVFWLVLVYYEMLRLCELAGMKAVRRLAVAASGILFFPLILYCSFVYGNLAGLALSLAAISAAADHVHTGKIGQMIKCAGYMAAAVLVRQNSMIFFIGIVIYVIFCILAAEEKKNRVKRMLFLLVLIAAVTAVNRIPVVFFRQATKEALDQGESPLSYVVMGLGESSLAPGWFNHYNYLSYLESGGVTAVQSELAKEEIRIRLRYFEEHKGDAVRHFLMKNASIWSNPTFQAFWIPHTRPFLQEPGEWYYRWFGTEGEKILSKYLDRVWFLILSGAFLHFVFGIGGKREKEKSVRCLDEGILIMIFVGGFLFHVFWEAKAQYTISYAVLLIPYAVSGYGALTEKMIKLSEVLRRKRSAKEIGEQREKILAEMLLIFLLLAVTAALRFRAHCLTEDSVQTTKAQSVLDCERKRQQ